MPGVKVKSLLSISNDLDCRKFHSKTLICHKGSAGTMPGGENIKEMWHSKYQIAENLTQKHRFFIGLKFCICYALSVSVLKKEKQIRVNSRITCSSGKVVFITYYRICMHFQKVPLCNLSCKERKMPSVVLSLPLFVEVISFMQAETKRNI